MIMFYLLCFILLLWFWIIIWVVPSYKRRVFLIFALWHQYTLEDKIIRLRALLLVKQRKKKKDMTQRMHNNASGYRHRILETKKFSTHFLLLNVINKMLLITNLLLIRKTFFLGRWELNFNSWSRLYRVTKWSFT